MSSLRRLTRMLAPNGDVAPTLPPWGPNFVSSVIGREDNRPEEARPDTDFIHVSSLVKDWCPRQYSLLKRLGKKGNHKYVTGGHRVMWAVGRAVEKHVRDQFIRGVNYHGVWGKWVCPCGIRETVGFADKVNKCRICHQPSLIYREFTLFNTVEHVAGNPDLIFVRQNRAYVMEIKSITDSESANKNGIGFSVITKPYADHMFQVLSYHETLAKILPEILPGVEPAKFVIVLYTTKDFKWGSPYKEYHESAEDNLWRMKSVVRPAMISAKKAWQAGQDATKPLPNKVCPNIHCPKAKACACAVECFAL